MVEDKTYNPFEGLRKVSEMWERQLNGLLYMMTDNKEFVHSAKIGLNAHSRYMELLKKNQELLAGFMNIPTKSDVANVAKLSIQAEQKMDALEEQIWSLHDNAGAFNKENMDLIQELMKLVKQMNSEIQKTAKEFAETKAMKSELQELRQAVVELRIMQVNIQELRKEFEDLKTEQENMFKNGPAERKLILADLQELKQEFGHLTDIKKEVTGLKKQIEKPKSKEKEKDLVESGTITTK